MRWATWLAWAWPAADVLAVGYRELVRLPSSDSSVRYPAKLKSILAKLGRKAD